MSLLPIIRAKDMIHTLLKAGFRIVRSRGSHFRFEHPLTKRQVTVAFHPGDLSRRMIHSILRQAGLTAEEFLRYLKGH
ncbi:MAG: type II toxin-antitoxin system HicA family toxin [Candidatus Sungiibacteriota bacterium]